MAIPSLFPYRHIPVKGSTNCWTRFSCSRSCLNSPLRVTCRRRVLLSSRGWTRVAARWPRCWFKTACCAREISFWRACSTAAFAPCWTRTASRSRKRARAFRLKFWGWMVRRMPVTSSPRWRARSGPATWRPSARKRVATPSWLASRRPSWTICSRPWGPATRRRSTSWSRPTFAVPWRPFSHHCWISATTRCRSISSLAAWAELPRRMSRWPSPPAR